MEALQGVEEDHITLVRERELMQRHSLILTFHDYFAHFLTLQPPTSCTCLPSSPTLSPAPANNPTRAQHYSPCPQAPRKTFRWRFNYMNKTLTSSYLILNCSRSKIPLHEPCFKTHSCDDTVEFYTHQVSSKHTEFIDKKMSFRCNATMFNLWINSWWLVGEEQFTCWNEQYKNKRMIKTIDMGHLLMSNLV